MKTLNYKEIYYTSSERSIITHSAGIGIRTYTNGMDSHEASTIAEKCVFGYSLDDSRKLTFEQIQQNPRIVYDYPPIYIYHKVTLDSGSIKYILGRTIYLGIDYGYFCSRNEAMRTGTNYFTHLLIFDEMPPISVLAEIDRKSVFTPIDYTCTPDNVELRTLLTGEPQLLSPKTIQCETSSEYIIDAEFAYCVIGFLQSYYNIINNKEDSLKKIIIKAPAKQTPELIKRMSLLPQLLIGEKTFLSNYMQGYGVPDDFNMVFVNEFNKNELYENNHICVDIFNRTTTNIDDNYIYKKILELGGENDNVTIQKLVNYYLGLDLTKELNYQFLYNLFIAIESDKDILLQDISQDFINQLNNVHLSSVQETELWKKINGTINCGLTSKKGSEINQAINIVGYVLPSNRRNLKITQESSTWITNVIFGENSYLSKIVNKDNFEIVMALVDRTKILSDNAFYNALKQSQDTIVWAKFIQFYYADSLKFNIESVIENVLASDLKKQEKEDLIKRLYPIDRCQNELLSYILNHTYRIPELIDIVKTICLNSREERFSLILKHSNNAPNIIKALSPIVLSYYGKQIDEDSNIGMKNVLSFIDKVSADVFNTMGLTELFDKYIRISMENPLKETKKIINTLLSSNVKIDRNTSDQITVLNNLFDNEIPKRVDVNVLFTAHKMDKGADYIRDLYEAWLKTQPTSKDLREYIKGVDYLSSDMIEEIILATWESRTRVIRENREDYVLIISDNSKWKSRDKKSFIKSCRDKDLVRHLTDSDKLIKKIIRKFLNLFK